jgi:gluconate 2-dehydrogenase gamma chain
MTVPGKESIVGTPYAEPKERRLKSMEDTPRKRRGLSRRTVLRGAGIAVGARLLPSFSIAAPMPVGPQAATARVTLTEEEYTTLDAIVARLIPADENGPGAREAMAARYIDRALGGALASSRDEYAGGLAAIDQWATLSRGSRFPDLAPPDQDAVLTEVEEGDAEGVPRGFFNTVRGHTIQGTFSDPHYGGNAGFVGWDMIGYPGVRVAVAAEYQQMDVEHPPNHVSAYDSPMFAPGED